jgi:hypothetical protein
VISELLITPVVTQQSIEAWLVTCGIAATAGWASRWLALLGHWRRSLSTLA